MLFLRTEMCIAVQYIKRVTKFEEQHEHSLCVRTYTQICNNASFCVLWDTEIYFSMPPHDEVLNTLVDSRAALGG